jgi:membrane-bound lytic murein transglycosylase D
MARDRGRLTPRIPSSYILVSPRRRSRGDTTDSQGIEESTVQRETTLDGPARPIAALALVVAVVAVVSLSACAPQRMREPHTRPRGAATAPAQEPSSGGGARSEAPVEPPPEGTDEAALAQPLAEPPSEEPPLAEGETVTESPLDRLADIEPELGSQELAAELDRVVEDAPLFDIPVEVNDLVLAWVDLYSGRLRESFEGGLARSGRYLEMFRRIFAEAGLPQDLVYMAHVESAYKTSAYSRAHARGIFQFMSSTARRYGLRVDDWIDERADPEKSARAAAAYMRDLYAEFGDWYLALAAYNAGEGKIRRALAHSPEQDFWSVARTRHVRRETKNHVPAILAATLLSKEPEKYGLRFTPEPPLRYDTIEVEGAVDLRVLARCAAVEASVLKELNPALRRLQTPPDGTTAVRVPAGSGPHTQAALAQVPPNERVLWVRHRVRQGDTLSELAGRYGVPMRGIQDANGLGRRTLIQIGQVLRIPTSAASRFEDATGVSAETEAGEALVTYHVQRGDTLYAIARRYGTTPEAIAAVNGIAVNEVLRAGARLRVVRGARDVAGAVGFARAGGARAAAAGANGRAGERVVHTVRSGDTLSRIAALYDTTVRALCAINEITPRTTIYPGTRLTVGFK